MEFGVESWTRSNSSKNVIIFCGLANSGITTTLKSVFNSFPNANATGNGSDVWDCRQYQIGQFRVIDFPGILCGNDELEVTNHARMLRVVQNLKAENQTITVVYVYPSYEIRAQGSDSSLRKSLKILNQLDFIRQGNLIVALTHAASSSNSTKIQSFLREAITKAAQVELLGFENETSFPIIFTENVKSVLRVDDGNFGNEGESILEEIQRRVSPSSAEIFQNHQLAIALDLNIPLKDSEIRNARLFLQSINAIRTTSEIGAPLQMDAHTQNLKFQCIEHGYDFGLKKIIKLSPKSLESTFAVKVGNELFKVSSLLAVSYPKLQVEYMEQQPIAGSCDSFSLTYQISMIQFQIADVDNYLLNWIEFMTDLNSYAEQRSDPATFCQKWGTHFIAREEFGAEFHILTKIPKDRFYQRSVPGNKINTVARKLIPHLEDFLLRNGSSQQCFSNLENFEIIGTKFGDRLKNEGSGIGLNELKEWVKRRQESPSPLPLVPDESTLHPYYKFLPLECHKKAKGDLDKYVAECSTKASNCIMC